MKGYLFLLTALFVAVLCSTVHADSVVVTNASTVNMITTFNFSGHGYVASGNQGYFDSSIFCDRYCEPSAFDNFRGTTLLAVAGPAGMALNGQDLTWEGMFGFTAVSYHSSLSPTGILTVFGMASGWGGLQGFPIWSPCFPVGPAIDVSGIWRYTATFVPNFYPESTYYADSMTLTKVPEPGTPSLLITSLITLSPLAFRRIRSAIGSHRV